MTSTKPSSIVAIVPAAGVGSRMKADRPKQYLVLNGKTVLEHTIEQLLSYPLIENVVVAITDGDPYFPELAIAQDSRVIRVSGGKERADSVLSGLLYIKENQLLYKEANFNSIQLIHIPVNHFLYNSISIIIINPIIDIKKILYKPQIIPI